MAAFFSARSQGRDERDRSQGWSITSPKSVRLEEEGILEEVTTDATLQILAWQIRNDLLRKRPTQSQLARLMGTSRSQVNRLMRADGSDIKVSTLEKAAKALDRKLKIELV